MVDLALAAFSASWPELIKPHPYIILGLFICGLVLFFWSFITALFGKTDIAPMPALMSASVHAPVSVTSQNPVSQVVNNYLTSPPNVTHRTETSVATKPAETRKSNIVFHGLTNSVDKVNQLPDTKPGDLICLLSLENRIPDLGKTGYTENVCASIRVSSGQDLTEFIPRAYWCDYWENEIAFPISSVEQVVIGRRVEGKWNLYGNPNQFKPRSGSTIRGAEIKSLPLDVGSLIAEIKVFNRRTGDVYATEKIEISLLAEDFVSTVRLL
jgi:hypothetical protein